MKLKTALFYIALVVVLVTILNVTGIGHAVFDFLENPGGSVENVVP